MSSIDTDVVFENMMGTSTISVDQGRWEYNDYNDVGYFNYFVVKGHESYISFDRSLFDCTNTRVSYPPTTPGKYTEILNVYFDGSQTTSRITIYVRPTLHDDRSVILQPDGIIDLNTLLRDSSITDVSWYFEGDQPKTFVLVNDRFVCYTPANDKLHTTFHVKSGGVLAKFAVTVTVVPPLFKTPVYDLTHHRVTIGCPKSIIVDDIPGGYDTLSLQIHEYPSMTKSFQVFIEDDRFGISFKGSLLAEALSHIRYDIPLTIAVTAYDSHNPSRLKTNTSVRIHVDPSPPSFVYSTYNIDQQLVTHEAWAHDITPILQYYDTSHLKFSVDMDGVIAVCVSGNVVLVYDGITVHSNGPSTVGLTVTETNHLARSTTLKVIIHVLSKTNRDVAGTTICDVVVDEFNEGLDIYNDRDRRFLQKMAYDIGIKSGLYDATGPVQQGQDRVSVGFFLTKTLQSMVPRYLGPGANKLYMSYKKVLRDLRTSTDGNKLIGGPNAYTYVPVENTITSHLSNVLTAESISPIIRKLVCEGMFEYDNSGNIRVHNTLDRECAIILPVHVILADKNGIGVKVIMNIRIGSQ